MNVQAQLQQQVSQALEALYGKAFPAERVTINGTRKEFAGDYTVVTFPFTKLAGKAPAQVAEDLGGALVQSDLVAAYNVVKGFLNLSINDTFWKGFLADSLADARYGHAPATGEKVMVEFSSPNTNKPLHLGHIRNILLGWATSKIQEAVGHEVVKVQIINDRGIAICKSMLAWQRYGNGETPASSGVKGDHLVGKYYVKFESAFREEYATWQATNAAAAVFAEQGKEGQSEAQFFKDYRNNYFNAHSELGGIAKQMLEAWEAGDPAVRALWAKMNGWVYAGFGETYRKMGVDFDKLYYESDTYLLGKEAVDKGLTDGKFYRKDDGSVWVDLTGSKLDHKLLLRSNGTSVYMTQDLGTAMQRHADFGVDKMVYVVADEQDYHFKVLFEILRQLDEPYADGLHHLSYGMVDLPTGKMKSREGTVVDADDLMDEVIEEARKATQESTVIADMDADEQAVITRQIGLAALKYYILRVNPKKRMTFDPKESVDLQGQTGPNIQYAYVRTQGVLRRAEQEGVDYRSSAGYTQLHEQEKALLKQLYLYPGVLQQAAANYDPSLVANFCYDLAKGFHRLWHEVKFFGAESDAARAFRLQLSAVVGRTLRDGLDLLGIEVPERM